MRVYQNKVEHKLRKKNANFRKSYTTVVQYGIEYRYCCICVICVQNTLLRQSLF